VILKTQHGETNPLKIKFSKTIKKGTLFSSFHHAKSHINYIFGDESDVNTKTALFKSVEVEVVPA
jgi:formate dehydrogenase major subunit